MGFGLLTTGLSIKRLPDIRDEIEAALRSVFGPSINLLPTELLGHIVGILSEREALIWELLQATHESAYPDTAFGTHLDNVAAITGIERLDATKSTVTLKAFGTDGAAIPLGAIVSQAGNSDVKFETVEAAIIGTGVNEVQEVSFSAVPDSGLFTLVFEGEETSPILFSATAFDVETALESLSAITDVSVSGDFTGGFVVTFQNSDGAQPQEQMTVGSNSLLVGTTPVDVTVSTSTEGVLPNVEIAAQAVTAGATEALAGTLTVIETITSGWDSVTNELDAVVGRDVETDAQFRIRRLQTLATAGAATVDSIRARILEIDEVTAALVFENTGNVTDFAGRPPKSFEAVVQGGDDQDIINAIWAVKPAGIESYGSTSGTAIDSQGFSHTVSFSRPSEIDIWLEIDLTTDGAFPVNGDTQLEEAILDYARENFSIGDDVIVFGSVSIASAISDSDIPGIIDYEIRVGTSPSPTLDSNVTIQPDEVAVFDSTRIAITVL